MNNFIKNKKFLIVFVLIIILALGVYFLGKYLQKKSPEYQAQKYLDELQKKYSEDNYGGNTPEETLNLFIEALKKGDTDLASKYFVIEKQEEWRDYFQKEEVDIKKIIDESQKLKLSKENDYKAFFSITNKDNLVEVQVILIKNIIINKWKIESL